MGNVGPTDKQVQVARRRGLVVPVHQAVDRMAGAPDTAEGRAIAAVFAAGPGAAASHAMAAWMWGLVPEPPARPEVTVPLPRYARLSGVTVHRATELRRAVDPHTTRRSDDGPFGWRRLIRQPTRVADQIEDVLATLRSG